MTFKIIQDVYTGTTKKCCSGSMYFFSGCYNSDSQSRCAKLLITTVEDDELLIDLRHEEDVYITSNDYFTTISEKIISETPVVPKQISIVFVYVPSSNQNFSRINIDGLIEFNILSKNSNLIIGKKSALSLISSNIDINNESFSVDRIDIDCDSIISGLDLANDSLIITAKSATYDCIEQICCYPDFDFIDSLSGIPIVDPDFNSVRNLLHMESGFLDSGLFQNHFLARGNTVADFNNKKLGVSSAYFDGSSGTYLESINNNFQLGSFDWTIEAWVYPESFDNRLGIWGHNLTSNSISFFSIEPPSGKLYFYSYNDPNVSSNVLVTNVETIETLTVNQWHHVAAVRSSGIVSFYINGTYCSGVGINETNSYTTKTSNPVIGIIANQQSWDDTLISFHGYIDEFRLTLKARYSCDFTPLNEPFADLSDSQISESLTQNICFVDP